jgi:catechol 2,3-dioxygenase-like lactoylglutathione lyase family enzyme
MIFRIDHINIVVTDLDRMIEFYTMLLGLKLTKRVTITGDWVAATVKLPEVHADVVYLDLAEGPRVELIRYNVPKLERPAGVDKPNSPGLRHFAFTVQDIDGVAGRLRERGVQFFSDVQSVPETQVTYAGGVRKRIVYFQDPEGNLLELCEYR